MPLLEDLYAKQRARQIELVPFFYSTSFAASIIAASTTVSQNIQVQADSHFVCRYINHLVYTGPAASIAILTIPSPVLINFFDTGSGRTLQDNPQPIQNLSGGLAAGGGATGQLPFILPEPWLIKAGGVVQVAITNLMTLAGNAVLRLDVSLVGFKVFAFGSSSPAGL
jgi:hypothetical protein